VLRSSDTPKLQFPIDLLRRPYNSVRTAVRHCESFQGIVRYWLELRFLKTPPVLQLHFQLFCNYIYCGENQTDGPSKWRESLTIAAIVTFTALRQWLVPAVADEPTAHVVPFYVHCVNCFM